MKKRVLVTGATGSIGLAICQKLNALGFKVYAQYYANEKEANALRKLGSVECIKVDFLVDNFIDYLPGEVDILVNNLGINITGDLVGDVSNEDWDKTLFMNLRVPFMLVKKYLPHMKKSNWGRIVNISSIYGLKGSPNNGPYNASKHALSGLTKSIAIEYAPYGVTSNEICPGPVDSVMLDRIFQEKAVSEGVTPEEVKQRVIDMMPSKMLIQPVDIASMVGFLIDSESTSMNGASVRIDGGMIA